MKNHFTYFFLLFAFALRAQFSADYKPLLSSSSIPKEYVVDISSSAKTNAENNGILSKETAEKYFTELFYLKKYIFETGTIYLPNALTAYVDSLFNGLLKYEPMLKQPLKIYVTRYGSANAFCLADGSIYINAGLIKTMQNEAELAFIIAHEIGHAVMQHGLKETAKLIDINKKENRVVSSQTNTFRQLRYSREFEQEADGYALSLINAAGFDASKAASALTRLKTDSAKTTTFDFEKLFNNSFFTLDTGIHVNSLIEKAKETLKKREEENKNSRLDDLYDTHPDMDKRIASVNELIRNIKPAKEKRKISSHYNYYKTLAAFEMCANNLREQDYINAIINALHLQKIYPDNTFLLNNITQSLYWISYYKELETSSLKVYGDLQQNTENYYALFALFSKLNLKESKQLAYAFLRSKEDKTETSEALMFYVCLVTENYLGKTGALDFYKSYLINYPNGAYSAFVRNKLK
ncbi:MAG: M48 family metallopeptidase [Bacteroidetes bacterium]|nr:M48 family metallopeptidase [Bacteroidota bacterium]